MWKAELTPNSSSGIGTFSSTCNFDVEGNPMSLLYGDNFIKKIDLTGKNYTFFQLFYNCSKLINAKNLSLPATILANYCYASMFNGCIALTVAPELPATILAVSCYNGMFYGCTSLTTAPKLPKQFDKLVKVYEKNGERALAMNYMDYGSFKKGTTPNGNEWTLEMNNGYTTRSRYCGTLYINGECIYTSGTISKAFEYILNN